MGCIILPWFGYIPQLKLVPHLEFGNWCVCTRSISAWLHGVLCFICKLLLVDWSPLVRLRDRLLIFGLKNRPYLRSPRWRDEFGLFLILTPHDDSWHFRNGSWVVTGTIGIQGVLLFLRQISGLSESWVGEIIRGIYLFLSHIVNVFIIIVLHEGSIFNILISNVAAIRLAFPDKLVRAVLFWSILVLRGWQSERFDSMVGWGKDELFEFILADLFVVSGPPCAIWRNCWWLDVNAGLWILLQKHFYLKFEIL